MSKKPRMEVETLGEGACHILRIGCDYVVFTESERAGLISMLQNAYKVTVLDSRRSVNGKRKTQAVGRRR